MTKKEPEELYGNSANINVTSIMLYLVLTSIVVLIIWRLTGYQPLQRSQTTQLTVPPVSQLSAYLLLATEHNYLLYFERQTNLIITTDLTNGNHIAINDTRFQEIFVSTSASLSNTLALVASIAPNRANLYLIDLTAEPVLRQLTKDDNAFLPSFTLTSGSLLSWSPNGTQIAFTAFENDRSDLFLVDTAGKQVSRLTYQQANISSILWLDDDTISFVWDWNGQDSIYKIDNDGGNLMRIK